MKLCYNVLGKKANQQETNCAWFYLLLTFAAFALLWGSKVARGKHGRQVTQDPQRLHA
jgi:hypothetical protein